MAVVAGSSRGIGLETVRHLAKQGLTVVLTARNHAYGLAIAKSVVDEGYPNVHFHQLDVQSDQSVSLLADWIKNKFGGIDILVPFNPKYRVETENSIKHMHHVKL